MPKDPSIHKVLIIGSGPIVIGQACEFDYSGTQACKALRGLGYQIVLVNSNPATIMTDPKMADATYIEPLDVATLERIIAIERPDALLPNLGGQTGLNLSSELEKQGILSKYGVRMIGVAADAIERGEDRQIFKDTMSRLGIETPKSEIAYSEAEALSIIKKMGLPCVVRPAYTMGGTGGGLVYNLDEFRVVVARGLSASPVHQVLIEESVEGWEELELEVVRDHKGQKITVCFIENIDAMGVHTGDSFCAAPMLDVEAEVQMRLQKQAYDIVDAIGVIGGTNVQFAYNPRDGRIVVIEINPRTSRSSALASKATGFPIAYVSALLAGGLTLDELPYWRNGTLEKYTPSGDYVVIKFARWAFEKFRNSEDRLGTQMRAVGEVMSIGRTYKEAFQKAIRSLETGRYGLGFALDLASRSKEELMARLSYPTSERQFIMYEALRRGATESELFQLTHIKPWFIRQMRELVELEQQLLEYRGKVLPDQLLSQAKRDGFSDRYLAKLLELPEAEIRAHRSRLGVVETWQAVPVSGVENAAYYFSTYNGTDQVETSDRPKVMVLGGGPNRIGQGIEFDYCCVHAALTLRELGFETIMVNCNPETVSTDYDTSDKLYFEPLTLEDVLSIYQKERPLGVIVQFGGQTPLNLCRELEAAGVPILGTSPEAIDLAEDRDRFRAVIERLGIRQPPSGMASNLTEAVEIASRIGYPLMVRPSYVLGGRGMEVVHDEEMLRDYVARAVGISPDRPILIDRFLSHALEVEADAISDGQEAFVPAIMEHIEEAGIHSGDSACVLPPVSISDKHQRSIEDITRRVAVELGVKGLINIQYAICEDEIFILEANPRASRTVPLVSKVCGLNMVEAATRIMMGQTLTQLGLKRREITHYGVKEAVFPFSMYHEVDPVLGPEMRSTGEVLGLASSFPLAFHKAQEGAKQGLPREGRVLLSVTDQDKPEALSIAREFARLGFGISATGGTQEYLSAHGVVSVPIKKMHEGRPNIADAIANGELQLVINSPVGPRAVHDDSYIRKAAVKNRVPYVTTMAAARASVRAIEAAREPEPVLRSLQGYHATLG